MRLRLPGASCGSAGAPMLFQSNASAPPPGLGEGEGGLGGGQGGALAPSCCSRRRDISSAKLQSWRACPSANALASCTCMAAKVSACWSLSSASANCLRRLAISSMAGAACAPGGGCATGGGCGGCEGGGVGPGLLLSGVGDLRLDLPRSRPLDLALRPPDGEDELVVRPLALRRLGELLLRDLEEGEGVVETI